MHHFALSTSEHQSCLYFSSNHPDQKQRAKLRDIITSAGQVVINIQRSASERNGTLSPGDCPGYFAVELETDTIEWAEVRIRSMT